MKNLVSVLLLLVILNACSNHSEHKKTTKAVETLVPSSIIGKQNIIDEIAGSAYRKRATAYFIVIENDTSKFMPIFYESKENSRVSIDLHLAYSDTSKSYTEQLNELREILPTASKDYNLDSLKNLRIGRLIITGDLAISITKEYKQKIGEDERIYTADYNKISDFLLESRLTKDLNEVFEPYATTVESVGVEKVFFSDKKYLIRHSSISEDTASIPDQIFDCSTWVSFKNKYNKQNK